MHFDIATHTLFTSEQNTFLTWLMKTATWFFNPAPFICVLVIVLSILLYFRKNTAVVFLSISLSLTFFLTWLLKYLTNIARPESGLVHAFGPSFPSAHTAMATTFFLSLAFIMRREWGRKYYYRFMPIAFVCIVLVGTSRIYLGVHWLTDVLAGYILGAICVYITINTTSN